MNLLENISKKTATLSDGQKKISDFLLRDGSALLVSTAREVAESIGVSESTVVRFAKELGYKGFPDFKRHLRKELRPRLRAAVRMQETITRIGRGENIVTKLIERDIQLLTETLESISHADFQKAVEAIWRAQKIFVVGFSSSLALACFLQFRLTRLGKKVQWIFLTGGTSLLEQLAFVERGDLVIAIGFLRTPQETRTAVEHAKKIGARVLGITDLPGTPIAQKADICLIARRGLHTTVNSLTAPFSLVNALVIAVALAKKADSLKALKHLDELLERYPV
ncbi:MAG: MurR/RpiR family transcriptional regulator [Candidatus Binatia bacterium]